MAPEIEDDDRNALSDFGYRHRMAVLYGLLSIVMVCLFRAPWSAEPGKWVNSAGLVADITGLIQLEISGVFGLLSRALFKLDEAGQKLPSSLVRQVVVAPRCDQNLHDRFYYWLTLSPKAGVALIAVGCALQLVATWL